MEGGFLVSPTQWTRSDVLELVTLLCGLPAAIVAIMIIAREWRNRCGE